MYFGPREERVRDNVQSGHYCEINPLLDNTRPRLGLLCVNDWLTVHYPDNYMTA